MRTIITLLLAGLSIMAHAQYTAAMGQPLTGPGSTEHYKHQELVITDCSAEAFGFWLYEPSSPRPDTAHVIIFMHGYGAYNPMLYGKWIKHLVAQGNIVIYPRYQLNLVKPQTEEFPDMAARGIQDAIMELQTNNHITPDLSRVVYVGHSYGGAIIAYLGVFWESMGVPKPAGMVLAQPGTGPLKGTLLTDYGALPSDMQLITIAGEDDKVVGEKLARTVFETAIHTPMRNMVMHYADTSRIASIEASHSEPYAIDYELDNGVRNYTAKRSIHTAKLDAVDFYCFWKFTDAVLFSTRSGRYGEYAFGGTPEQLSLGIDALGNLLPYMRAWLPPVSSELTDQVKQ
jgi:acetyl esterase/lipase